MGLGIKDHAARVIDDRSHAARAGLADTRSVCSRIHGIESRDPLPSLRGRAGGAFGQPERGAIGGGALASGFVRLLSCSKMAEHRETWSAAWSQFYNQKRRLLTDYRLARQDHVGRPVQTEHGRTAEALIRQWLEVFLPRRYAVTPGYIRSQGGGNAMASQFDVIVYDQLEAPVLWTGLNPDASVQGQSRIIPAEYVHAVLEVKSTFSRQNVLNALNKLEQLNPLMAGEDYPADSYPQYLPQGCAVGIVFFELRQSEASEISALELLRALRFKRSFLGPVVLSGEGVPDEETGRIAFLRSREHVESMILDGNLLAASTMPESTEVDGHHYTVRLSWARLNFCEFAFDLLAIMKGKYRPTHMSSMHCIDMTVYDRAEDERR